MSISTFIQGVSTITTQTVKPTSNTTTSSAAFADMGLAVTLPNRTGGKALITFVVSWSINSINNANLRLIDGVSGKPDFSIGSLAINDIQMTTLTLTTTLSGQVVALQGHTNGVDVLTVQMGSASTGSYLNTLEIS